MVPLDCIDKIKKLKNMKIEKEKYFKYFFFVFKNMAKIKRFITATDLDIPVILGLT